MLVQQVFAQQAAIPSAPADPNFGIESIPDAFGVAMNLVLGIGIALTVIFLILGGIQYITSKGDQKAAETARKTLTNAVIGFIIVVGAFAIRTIVVGALDVGNIDVGNVTPGGN